MGGGLEGPIQIGVPRSNTVKLVNSAILGQVHVSSITITMTKCSHFNGMSHCQQNVIECHCMKGRNTEFGAYLENERPTCVLGYDCICIYLYLFVCIDIVSVCI